MAASVVALAEGLSPRVRGNPSSANLRRMPPRPIPACAGEPSTPFPKQFPSTAYPRVCGGTPAIGSSTRSPGGLSPRVRGNRLHGIFAVHPRGPIPACAGEPITPTPARSMVKAYPRVCGGTASDSGEGDDRDGLSPRVRGNPEPAEPPDYPQRPIPACAGEPEAKATRHAAPEAYPRVCGGTLRCAIAKYHHIGLSPRVRGNPRQPLRTPAKVRPIPACAGEPLLGQLPRRPWRAYPRVCGGTAPVVGLLVVGGGLSPRVRGNLIQAHRVRQRIRPIPACAGEPLPQALLLQVVGAYPRVCGGTTSPHRENGQVRGLSPRVRGNQVYGPLRQLGKRPIPACAGEPTSQPEVMPAGAAYPRVCGGTSASASPRPSFRGLSPRVRGNH